MNADPFLLVSLHILFTNVLSFESTFNVITFGQTKIDNTYQVITITERCLSDC
jgi:hypothetical protein